MRLCQIGGATGRVGDPSGRKIERELAKTEQVEENARSLTNSITQFFERGLAYANSRMETVQQAHSGIRITNNLEWHDGFSLLGFLQEVGSYARVNTMLNRERYVPAIRHLDPTLTRTQCAGAIRGQTGPLVYRVHIPTSASIRLPLPVQAPRMQYTNWRIRPVGQHRSRAGVDWKTQRTARVVRSLWNNHTSPHYCKRREIRQKRRQRYLA